MIAELLERNRGAWGGRRSAVASNVAWILLFATSAGGAVSTSPDDITAISLPVPVTQGAEQLTPAPVASPEPSGRPVVHDPATIRIPAIGVEAPMTPLGLDDGGALEAPEDFSVVGWYEDGPEPGEPGPTVVAGHVDSYDGPAVFYRLEKLVAGNEVRVIGADGVEAVYTVTRIEQYAKDSFPTDQVYAHSGRSTLRLVTCGGDFDQAERSYEDNVVVYAE